MLSERKIEKRHGEGVVNRLSVDLKLEFPDMGLSPRNLWHMKRFYERYIFAEPKLKQAVSVLPWGHNILLINKITDNDEAYWYALKAAELGWSRNILLNYLKADSFHNEIDLPKSHNFNEVLPETVAEQAEDMLKSSYNLGFLGLTKAVKERELERRLIERIKQFILGKGFTYIGHQHCLEFNGKEYFIDTLLYHRGLRALLALELKIGSFKPEYVGKMNFYLGLLDKLEKRPEENPSIGIILCADKDHLDVEIALQGIQKPIAVAEYKLLLPTKELESVILEEMKKIESEKEGDDE